MEMFGIWLAVAAVVLIFGFVIIYLINEISKRNKEIERLESRINRIPDLERDRIRKLEENSREQKEINKEQSKKQDNQDIKLSLLMDYFDLRYRKIDAHYVVEKINNEDSV